MIDRKRTACFTGHRDIPMNRIEALENLLDRVIEQLYSKGVVFYGVGGSYGFDLLAEKSVLRARERHSNIKLILVLPCIISIILHINFLTYASMPAKFLCNLMKILTAQPTHIRY